MGDDVSYYPTTYQFWKDNTFPLARPQKNLPNTTPIFLNTGTAITVRCPVGQSGSIVSVNIVAYTVPSRVSVDDANAQALAMHGGYPQTVCTFCDYTNPISDVFDAYPASQSIAGKDDGGCWDGAWAYRDNT